MYAPSVDVANENVKCLYEEFRFLPLTDDPMRLFLPLGQAVLQGSKR